MKRVFFVLVIGTEEALFVKFGGENSMRKKEKIQEQKEKNNALLNVITPMGISFTKNGLSIGENYGKIYGIIRYPQKVEMEWLSKITNIPSSIVSIGTS